MYIPLVIPITPRHAGKCPPDTLSVVLGVTEFTYLDILSECPLSLIGRKHYCFVVAGRLSEKKNDEITLNSNQSSF